MPPSPAIRLPYHHSGDDDGDGKLRRPRPHSHLTQLRSSSFPLPLLLLTVTCLTIAIASLSFALSVSRRPPRVITVVRCGRAEDKLRPLFDGAGKILRPRVLAVVGVMTGYGPDHADRRAALRATWFPPTADLITSLQPGDGMAFRFVIGHTNDQEQKISLQREVDMYHDFMFIDAEEERSLPPRKTLAYFKAAYDLFDAEFYVKADDDIYLRPDRLGAVLAKDRSHRRIYLGCMKKGPVITDSNSKWFESSGDILGNEYFLHAFGPLYALSSEAVSLLASAKNDSLRMFSHEDVTVGSWMLAMNANHEDNQAICDKTCTATSIAVWDIPRCSGVCDVAQKIRDLHNNTMCSRSRTVPAEEDEEE